MTPPPDDHGDLLIAHEHLTLTARALLEAAKASPTVPAELRPHLLKLAQAIGEGPRHAWLMAIPKPQQSTTLGRMHGTLVIDAAGVFDVGGKRDD